MSPSLPAEGPGFDAGGACWRRNVIFQKPGPSWEPGKEWVKHVAG